ncbi:MAG TPA: glycosyltransferase family 2 protein [Roseiflexaceae bacterium]|nr:glycosyltransferase family 2 protein [Roseiflexaceae bacterium]
MRATIIVLSWNGADELPACLDAVLSQAGAAADLLVVDNGSVDGSAALVRERYPAVRLVENARNLGFAAGMNVGMRLLRAAAEPPDVVVLLNQDTVVAPNWLRSILEPFEQDERIGAVGSKIYYPDGRTLQHAGAWIEPGRAIPRHYGYGEIDRGQYDQPRDVEYVTGAALALRMRALDQVGLLDEGYTHFVEDVDLCWRLRRASYLVHYAPTATLRHAESTSVADWLRRVRLFNRNRLRYVVKTAPPELLWTDFLVAERAYLAASAGGPDLRALRWAYLDGILCRAEWRRAREQYYAVTPDERARLNNLCAELCRSVIAYK